MRGCVGMRFIVGRGERERRMLPLGLRLVAVTPMLVVRVWVVGML